MADETAFGPFLLDAGRGELLRDGAPVALGQRALAVLAALVEARGRTVGKDALLARAWPDTIVEEGNLTVQVAALRRALGTTADGSGWIQTVPRVGYRLLATAGEPAAAPAGPPLLAVLPFENLGEAADGWFADGVVDDIITALSRFRSFAVIARNSSFAYRDGDRSVREVARDLGVRYLLVGSLRRSGERLRITAQLVGAPSETTLWAQSFDGLPADVFAFQDRITESIATIVEPQIQAAEIALSRLERPESVAAYDIFLRAKALILAETAAANAEAHRLLDAALALEPDNPLLIAHAAWVLEHRHTMGWMPLGPDDVARCTELARRGLEKAGGDATVMAHCGMALLQVAKLHDWGMAVLEEALEINPNNLTVVTCAGVGHLHCGSLETAIELFERAIRLSPRDPVAHITLCGIADVHFIRGDYREARRWAARSHAVNPNFDAALWVLIAAHAHLGELDDARRYLGELRSIAPQATVATICSGQPAADPSRYAALYEGLRIAGLPEADLQDLGSA